MNAILVTILVFLLSALGCSNSETAGLKPEQGVSATNDFNLKGKGAILFNSYLPLKEKPVNIHYYTPVDNPSDLPILFVCHGTNRNGGVYRDRWIELANEYQILIIAPEFSDTYYPSSRSYNLGNMFDKEGNSIEEDKWSFSLIEVIFDYVVSEIKGTQTSYDMFGHSAGGQFVHRFLTYKKNLRIDQCIAANPGWYTLTDFNVEFPYGLKNSPVTQKQIEEMYQKPLTILLGEEDTKRDSNLRTTEEADAQGPHRLARGKYYYKTAKEFATQYQILFNWNLQTVPNVGHSSSGTAIPAAEILYGNKQ